MMNETFRTRLKRGDLLLGTVVTLANPAVAEILAGAGFDWLFVDLEHSPMGMIEAQAIQQTVGDKVACILRLPLNDEIWIKKALDSGVAGIMLPQVNTAEDARRAVRLSKYPPQGRRSIGAARANGYGTRVPEYVANANSDTLVIAQAESIEAVRNIESILSTQGLDAILVGPFDLSASMGLIGLVEHASVQAAIAQVRQACQARSMPLGIYAANARLAKAYTAQGFTLVATSTDTVMLDQASRMLLAEIH
jgi:2-dehydro-3-deoxyglucarate aldolase